MERDIWEVNARKDIVKMGGLSAGTLCGSGQAVCGSRVERRGSERGVRDALVDDHVNPHRVQRLWVDLR